MVMKIGQATFDQLAAWLALLTETHARAGREAVERRDEVEALHHWRVLCEMARAGGMLVADYESPRGRVVLAG